MGVVYPGDVSLFVVSIDDIVFSYISVYQFLSVEYLCVPIVHTNHPKFQVATREREELINNT